MILAEPAKAYLNAVKAYEVEFVYRHLPVVLHKGGKADESNAERCYANVWVANNALGLLLPTDDNKDAVEGYIRNTKDYNATQCQVIHTESGHCLYSMSAKKSPFIVMKAFALADVTMRGAETWNDLANGKAHARDLTRACEIALFFTHLWVGKQPTVPNYFTLINQ